MKLSVFEKGLTIPELRNMISIIKSKNVEIGNENPNAILIHDLDKDGCTYEFLCTFNVNTVYSVYFLASRDSKYGVYRYDLVNETLTKEIDVIYDNIEVGFESVFLGTINGVESLIIDGVSHFTSYTDFSVRSFLHQAFILEVDSPSDGYTAVVWKNRSKDKHYFKDKISFVKYFRELIYELSYDGLIDDLTFGSVNRTEYEVCKRLS